MDKIVSTNPARNYEVIGEVEASSEEEIKEKVAKAKQAQTKWKALPLSKRIEYLKPIREELEKRKDEISQLITKETGKLPKGTLGEVEEGLKYFDDFVNNVESYIKPEVAYQEGDNTHNIVFDPLGVAAIITPWNFPFGSFVWTIVPNLLVGNTVVYKTSEECILFGKLIDEIMNNHNLPENVFNEIYGAGKVGASLVDQDINLICFTGSTKVGQELYKKAGEKFIKVVLEMGGSNPGIVFEDAEINTNLCSELSGKRFANCGQYCDALKRLLVHESRFEEVVSQMKETIEKIVVGDPQDEKTTMSSLVAERQLTSLKVQVQDAIEKGAKVITGGKSPKNLQGAYYEPTLLTNITKDMKVWKEEVFGPVLPIISFKTEEEAIEMANDTIYGLGAGINTSDPEKAERVASKLNAGTVGINSANLWSSQTPFGGYKKSGMGRELGIHGFRELCQIKVIAS
jgi:acyl-CoA reductase-like NAD-dependent aldehyde dehydrogenase